MAFPGTCLLGPVACGIGGAIDVISIALLSENTFEVGYTAIKRQADYIRADDFCDSPPDPGKDECSTLSKQIDHPQECINRYEYWDATYQPGRHAIKISDWKNRLDNLKEEHNRKCVQQKCP
jgi:type VI secretion system secreted protein VgrG